MHLKILNYGELLLKIKRKKILTMRIVPQRHFNMLVAMIQEAKSLKKTEIKTVIALYKNN